MEELMFSACASGAGAVRTAGAEGASLSPEGVAQPVKSSVNSSAVIILRMAVSPFPQPGGSSSQGAEPLPSGACL